MHRTSGQTPEGRAPLKAILCTRARGPLPSHPGSPKPGPRGPPEHTQLRVRRLPPAAPLTSTRWSILLGCRSRPVRGSPCPAGGRTQTRSPARESPGERRAGSILSGKLRTRVRAGGGDRSLCGAQTRLLPRPPPRANPAAHLLAPGHYAFRACPLGLSLLPGRSLCSPPERAPTAQPSRRGANQEDEPTSRRAGAPRLAVALLQPLRSPLIPGVETERSRELGVPALRFTAEGGALLAGHAPRPPQPPPRLGRFSSVCF